MDIKEYRGLWWKPSDEQHKVAGILTYIPSDEFKLELIGSFRTEEEDPIMKVFRSSKIENIIHGQASDGSDITLFECGCSMSYNGKADFITSIYTARVIAIGKHINSLEESIFNKATVKIPELSYWLYPAIVKSVYHDTEYGREIMVKMESLSDNEREEGKVDISKTLSMYLCRDASYSSGNLLFKPTFEQYTTLKIESNVGISLVDFYKFAVRYEGFLSFATFREVGFSELQLFSNDNYVLSGEKKIYKPIVIDTRFHAKPNNKKIERHKFIFTYDQIKDKYPIAIKKWFTNDSKFDAIRAHFLDSIDYHGPFSYINFLVVIQAIEGFGRRYMKQQITAYKNTLPKDRKVRPLFEYVSAIFANYSDIKCIKQDVKIDAITETRNYHSHLLPQRTKNVVDEIELYNLTEELRKLLICCIMTYMGFTNNEIDNLTSSSECNLFQP